MPGCRRRYTSFFIALRSSPSESVSGSSVFHHARKGKDRFYDRVVDCAENLGHRTVRPPRDVELRPAAFALGRLPVGRIADARLDTEDAVEDEPELTSPAQPNW